ncbi:hypothetical protein QKW35_09795 [Pontibacterium granulatum]|uniref:hypothetical protein n=1 Tax=Pontibacterium granulatum TaxID=2036029 RepID=UPI00249A57A8|nr:hypothetical protein [Pontibacterium granulatum]MDI3324667.1 hypothetical protein [Pontibacterium granulatum]
MLAWLLQAMEEAAAQKQFLQLEPPLFLYHRGVYSNAASVWSQNPKALQAQTGRFDICAQLSENLCLLILNNQQWQDLCQHLAIDVSNTAKTLNQLCELLNNSNLEMPAQLQGLTCNTDNSTTAPFMLLFKPLRNLQLYDIQDLLPDS